MNNRLRRVTALVLFLLLIFNMMPIETLADTVKSDESIPFDMSILKGGHPKKAQLALLGNSDLTKVYNGSEQRVTGYTHTGLLDGHRISSMSTLTHVAKGTLPDTYTGAFNSGTLIIRDRHNRDVTDYYEVIKTPGTLIISKAQLALLGNSDLTKVYDGTEQRVTGYTHTGLLDGHTISADSTLSHVAKGTLPDTYTGAFDSGTLIILDENDNDVTANYEVTKTPGTLIISKAQLALLGNSDLTKVYNGSEQRVTGYTHTGLLDGHRISRASTLMHVAKGTLPDTYTGAFNSGTLIIRDENDDFVTDYYEVIKTPGTLIISKAQLALLGNSDLTKVYDGTEQRVTGYTHSGLLPWHRISPDSTLSHVAKGTLPDTYTGAFDSGTLIILDWYNRDVTDYYEITKTPGTLKIDPLAVTVTITGNNDTKTYDGTEYEATNYTAAYSSTLYTANDYTFSGTASARRTDVGTTYMGLMPEQFTNTNPNFDPVTFDVADGWMTITQNPSIALVKTADLTTISAPGNVIYTYTISNTGDVPLTSVSVVDNKIVGTIIPLHTTLAPGQTTTATAIFPIKQERIDAGLAIENTATVSGLAPDRETVVEWTDSAVVSIEQDPGVSITKEVDKLTYSAADTVLNYTVTAQNAGNVTLFGAQLTDFVNGTLSIPMTLTGDSDDDGDIDVGETWIYTGSYTTTQDDLDADLTILNEATITARPPMPPVQNGQDNTFRMTALLGGPPELTGEEGPVITATAYAETEAVPEASLAITKTVDKATYNAANTVLNYTVTVVNTGNVTLENAVMTDFVNTTIPVTMTLAGDTDADGDINVGETWIYKGTYTTMQDDLDADLTIINVASIVTDRTEEQTAQAATDALPVPSLTITKTVDKATYNAAGTALNYTVTVVNTGNATLENAALTDFVNNAIPIVMTKTGDIDDDGDIDVGETWIYTGTYMTTQADLDGNLTIANVATILTNQTVSSSASAETTAVQPRANPQVPNRILAPAPVSGLSITAADGFE